MKNVRTYEELKDFVLSTLIIPFPSLITDLTNNPRGTLNKQSFKEYIEKDNGINNADNIFNELKNDGVIIEENTKIKITDKGIYLLLKGGYAEKERQTILQKIMLRRVTVWGLIIGIPTAIYSILESIKIVWIWFHPYCHQ